MGIQRYNNRASPFFLRIDNHLSNRSLDTGLWSVVPTCFRLRPFSCLGFTSYSRPATLRYMKASVVDLQPSSSFGLPLGPVSCILPVAVTGIWSLLVNSRSQAIYQYCNAHCARNYRLEPPSTLNDCAYTAPKRRTGSGSVLD